MESAECGWGRLIGRARHSVRARDAEVRRILCAASVAARTEWRALPIHSRAESGPNSFNVSRWVARSETSEFVRGNRGCVHPGNCCARRLVTRRDHQVAHGLIPITKRITEVLDGAVEQILEFLSARR